MTSRHATDRPTILPQKWDEEADIVVVGFGAAGFATSVTANDLGADVLILEKAPPGEEGGNTRVAGQGYLNTSNEDDAATYLSALCGPYPVPDEMIEVWAREMCLNNAWLSSLGADPQEHQHPPVGIEFPELPGSQCVHKFHDGPTYGFSNTWKCFEGLVKRRPIRICYETPANGLIQDGASGEILGVRATRDAKRLSIRARKAVVLTCGGFENNQEMVRNYLPGLPYCYTSGSPHNEGDGIDMALSVGADLWHMNNFAGLSMALKVPEIPTTFSMQALHFSKQFPGGMIVVGPDGKRFGDEKYKNRHGKIPIHGVWKPMPTPCPMFMIFDEQLMTAGPLYDKTPRYGWTQIVERYDWSEDNRAELERGWIRRAETVAELATTIGIDPTSLASTIERWNGYARNGEDRDYGRTLMLSEIKPGPLYAVPLSPSMLNTQGGPRRNEKAQILRPGGAPIPRLYSAGELGSIYSNLYQGTGNIGECLVFGRIAARNAVNETPW
ncbi:MAG: FAD-binding protein [Gammaproteobacteria bacterium]|nr:FAD-binding protein [Gammaproteobacteria bacterium]